MATKRVSQLTETTTPASGDYIPILQSSTGQTKKVSVKNLTGIPDVGWSATGESWTYSSFSSVLQTGVVTVPSDATVKYAIGMWVRFVQTTGGTKYGKIIAVTSTSLTIDFPNGTTLTNEALSTIVYSPLARPVGVPTDNNFTHTYTNTSSGGGTGYFRNDAGVKRCWGTTGAFNTVGGSNYGASMPVGFFSTGQSVVVFIAFSSTTITWIGGAWDTTQVIVYIATASSNNKLSWIYYGT